ncbi:hypothetical protein BH20VER3_BH20VER3_17820 [soil metagenome]
MALVLSVSSLTSMASLSNGQTPTPPADESNASVEALAEPKPGDLPAGFGSGDVSPTENTDVSTMITTDGGSGYDAWTGAMRRVVTDIDVPGAVSSHGLKIVRTYTSSTGIGWSFSWTWQVHARPFTSDGSYLINFPDGRAVNFYPPSIPGETAYRAGRGTKERFFRNSPGSANRSADLYLEDGSHVHFRWIAELSGNDQYPIDYFFPETFTDPHGLVTILQYTQYGTEYNDTHLTKVIDPSGRSLTYNYDATYGTILTSIVASTGQSVSYNSDGTVSYSDGTSASYTYGDTTYKNSVCPGEICHADKLSTAADVRAEGPMRSIKYTYQANANFQGQVAQEQHPSGLEVSKFAPTNERGSMSATNVEFRGDGPQRSFYIAKSGNTPLLRRKSDFKGAIEIYAYDGNNYLKSITDRNGNVTTFMNESILGRPTKVTHPAGTFTTGASFGSTTRVYSYTDASNPYYVSSIKDDRGNLTTYQRDPVTHRITEIDYPDGGMSRE